MLFVRFILLSLLLFECNGCSQTPLIENQNQIHESHVIVETISLQAFILINYGPLSTDILRGEGEFLEGLYSLSNSQDESKEKLTQVLQQLLIKEPDIYQFSVAVNTLMTGTLNLKQFAVFSK